MLPVLDDGSLDSSLGWQDSESEGGIWDGHNDDFAPNAPEGATPERAQLIPIDFDNNIGPSANSSPRRRPYDAGPHPPLIIEPQIIAPEGALQIEPPAEVVEKQNSILPQYGDEVLMANGVVHANVGQKLVFCYLWPVFWRVFFCPASYL